MPFRSRKCALFLIHGAPTSSRTLKLSLSSERSKTSMAYPTNYRYTREHEWISARWRHRHHRHHRLCAELAGRHRLRGRAQGGRHSDRQRNVRIGREREGRQRSLFAGERHGDRGERGAEDLAGQDQRAPHETWIIKVELSDPSEFDKLLDAAAYEEFISEETGAIRQPSPPLSSSHVESRESNRIGRIWQHAPTD